MIRAEWANNDALSAEQATQTNAPNVLNSLDCISQQAEIISTAERASEVRFPVLYAEKSAERKHGKWIGVDEDHWVCSVCNEEWNIYENDVYRFLFCPNCGADMREETDGRTENDRSDHAD